MDAITAATWIQRDSGSPCRVPVGVIGPRAATAAQLDLAEAVGGGVAKMGFAIICGGRDGVMAAVGKGARAAGGTSIGLLPEADAAFANPYIDFVIATGIGEARNALIARAALCLVAIGNSYGTLSEVALGRHFGKLVIGLEGAAQVEGVRHVDEVAAALTLVAECAIGQHG
ncbi:MAG: lysine decarboxylase [Casimicrobiaceae bacterium]